MIHNIQALMDGLSADWQRIRAGTQMTLGSFMAALEALPDGVEIDAIEAPQSYRGYYCDLAFERGEGKMSVEKALEICRSAMGEVFEGYKGGDYMMGKNTPVWLADYGSCGPRIMEVSPDGEIITADEDEDDVDQPGGQ